MKKFPLPNQHKIETYRALKHEATFDRVEYAVTLIPGLNGHGAVMKGFIDAIANHDIIVKEVEDKFLAIDALKKDLMKKSRLFRNMDSVWTCLNLNPDEYNEFLSLQPRMKNIHERIKRMNNFKAKARAEAELKRYQELLPLGAKLKAVQKELDKARVIRDEARETLKKAEEELAAVRQREREAASVISDDHVIADEKKIPLCELFPNVHAGFQLYSLNGHLLSEMSYEHLMAFVKRARSPHRVDFRRYDYKFDAFNGVWNSLQELRDMGECVADPMLMVRMYVE